MSKSKAKIGTAICVSVSGKVISGDIFRRSDGVWEVVLSDFLVPADRLQLKLEREFGSFEAFVGVSQPGSIVEARFETGVASVDGLRGELRVFGRQSLSRTLLFDGPMVVETVGGLGTSDDEGIGVAGKAVAMLREGIDELGWIYRFCNEWFDIMWLPNAALADKSRPW